MMLRNLQYSYRYSRPTGGQVFMALAALIIAGHILRGFVLSRMWDWFILPFGVQSITIAHAIGLSLIVGFLLPVEVVKPQDGDFWEKYVKALMVAIIIPIAFLIFGWIIHLFV